MNGEKDSQTLAKKGLKEGLRDMISSINAYPQNLVQEIDNNLKNNDLPNIKLLQLMISDTIRKVLKRNKIKKSR